MRRRRSPGDLEQAQRGRTGKPSKVLNFATDVTAAKIEAANAGEQIEAIGKSQAVIEFAMDGTILTANDNFLATIGEHGVARAYDRPWRRRGGLSGKFEALDLVACSLRELRQLNHRRGNLFGGGSIRLSNSREVRDARVVSGSPDITVGTIVS